MNHSLFDRAAIAFGAMVIGCGAGLVVAVPVLLLIKILASEPGAICGSLFWKAPLLLGGLFGITGFISPNFAADWLGRAWKGAVYVWRILTGA